MNARSPHKKEGRGGADVNAPLAGVKNPKTTAFRVNDLELEAIRIAAARRGLTAAAYLREVVIPVAFKEAA